ncbi:MULTISPECIES: hypothetical protein [Sphingomonas]|uniref:hypothetical protein n=1 Tax=Sphingomonas TaxID=13687 RepID=UPI001269D2C7|nr:MULTISPECIES: hypothetical protein [Sphingomonas]
MIGLALALAASELPPPARPPAYSIREVWQNHVALDGQVIRVRGVVTDCRALSCSLREHRGPSARTLSLGNSERFDAEVQSTLGLPITVEGRLNAACLHAAADREFGAHGRSEMLVCTDRADMVREPRMVSNR